MWVDVGVGTGWCVGVGIGRGAGKLQVFNNQIELRQEQAQPTGSCSLSSAVLC
jgi:hypothetical protein